MDEEKLLISAWNHAKSLRKTITEPTEEDEMVWGIEDKRYERRLWEAQKEKMQKGAEADAGWPTPPVKFTSTIKVKK